MATILTYDNLIIRNDEIVSFDFGRSFNINSLGTVALLEITQPGNLSPVTFNIRTRITDNASSKFTLWSNKLASKPLFDLTFLSRSWGNFYLTDLAISCDELDNNGDILRMNMDIKFLSNQNFG